MAFGKDLLDEGGKNWAINYNNGFYQYFREDYMLQFNGENAFAMYNFATDTLLKENIVNEIAEQDMMTEECKGIIQQYIERMTENRLKE